MPVIGEECSHAFQGYLGGYASRRTYLPGEAATLWIATDIPSGDEMQMPECTISKKVRISMIKKSP